MVIERIGVDLGSTADVAGADLGGPELIERRSARIAAAAALGARLVRIRFGLDGRRVVDDAFLADARSVAEAVAMARLRLLAVVDGSLTVAPGALADDDTAAPSVAAAWAEELAEHAALLAGAIGDLVTAWEIVPGPNQAHAGRGSVPPARWAALLQAVGGAIRAAAPGATIVAGALSSTPDDDAVDYLRAAIEAGRWSVGTPPFELLGLRLHLIPEGGVDEAAVGAAVAERTGRVWRAAVAALGRHAGDLRALWVTGLSWDAYDTGDAVQARNLWTAFDTLTADPNVGAVVWTALSDDGAANGLFASADLDPASARPAWKAFNDFTQYARQIGGAPSLLFDPDAPPLPGLDAGGAMIGELIDDDGTSTDEDDSDGSEHLDWDDADPRHLVRGPIDADRDDIAYIDADHDDVADIDTDHDDIAHIDPDHDDIAHTDSASVTAPSAMPPGRIRFRVPTVGELLAAAGIPDQDLEAALATVEARYGSRELLPPGDYTLDVDLTIDPNVDVANLSADALAVSPTPPATLDLGLAAAVPATRETAVGLTNQHVLSAFYRAGGGSWNLLQRANLDLADLVSQRDEPYRGTAVAQMENLSATERAAVLGELGGAP